MVRRKICKARLEPRFLVVGRARLVQFLGPAAAGNVWKVHVLIGEHREPSDQVMVAGDSCN